ncbi:hypothetical protein SLEP1_g22488 [Rubroshorea leprosula]|uniref:Uncharacterized protein n=1 Tax=Rubroshorea leprosula TaxID=152421 RepID=A0AAV5JIL4_9ROSI|nr:hypothetical protein SLEP1_g22488 [Rubroshorea leprosula]
MLNPTTGWTTLFSPPFLPTVFKHSSKPHPNPNSCSPIISTFRALRLGYEPRAELGPVCCARRRSGMKKRKKKKKKNMSIIRRLRCLNCTLNLPQERQFLCTHFWIRKR